LAFVELMCCCCSVGDQDNPELTNINTAEFVGLES